jgi:phage gp46-like protein
LTTGTLGIYFKYAASNAFGGSCPVTPDSPGDDETVYVKEGDPVITVSGIPSGEAFGTPTVLAGNVNVSPVGIASEEAFGSPSGVPENVNVAPDSIPSGEAFGAPSVNITTTVQSALPPPSPAKEGDIRIAFDQYDQFADFILADRDVDRDDGLETAVLITLLTDKHADAGDPLPDDSGYRGGWFGDSLPVVPDYKMGTKLWLLQRAKTVTEIPAIAKEHLLDGFKWMIEDGIVKSVDVTVERRRDLKTTLAFTISFTKPEGTTIFYSFYYNWEAQLLRRQ